MTERRKIGLQVAVGAITFDLLMMKLALDAVDRVKDVQQLGWILRIAAIAAFLGSVGMLAQIEARSKKDRTRYDTAAAKAEAIREGNQLPAAVTEDFWKSFWRSWATTWPLLGVLGLTISVCWFAALLKATK
ncbi:hypothetical protein ACFWBN_36230 [Streptomyces sp. NPDC059989]|uniref:hypothetical protein n=1 Tax=Streptomyces sp. NPDC059989 TaxID=3347026 RepID=UPI0036ABFDA4